MGRVRLRGRVGRAVRDDGRARDALRLPWTRGSDGGQHRGRTGVRRRHHPARPTGRRARAGRGVVRARLRVRPGHRRAPRRRPGRGPRRRALPGVRPGDSVLAPELRRRRDELPRGRRRRPPPGGAEPGPVPGPTDDRDRPVPRRARLRDPPTAHAGVLRRRRRVRRRSGDVHPVRRRPVRVRRDRRRVPAHLRRRPRRGESGRPRRATLPDRSLADARGRRRGGPRLCARRAPGDRRGRSRGRPRRSGVVHGPARRPARRPCGAVARERPRERLACDAGLDVDRRRGTGRRVRRHTGGRRASDGPSVRR